MQFLKNKSIELIRGNIDKNTSRQILVHKDLDTYVIGNKENILTAEGTLTHGAMIIYILQFADGTYKLGQILETKEKSVAGQQGVEIWKDSYNGRKSSVSGTITLRGIFYIDRLIKSKMTISIWRIKSNKQSAIIIPFNLRAINII